MGDYRGQTGVTSGTHGEYCGVTQSMGQMGDVSAKRAADTGIHNGRDKINAQHLATCPSRVANKLLTGFTPTVRGVIADGRLQRATTGKNDTAVATGLPRTLLDNGQGEFSSSDMEIDDDEESDAGGSPAPTILGIGQGGQGNERQGLTNITCDGSLIGETFDGGATRTIFGGVQVDLLKPPTTANGEAVTGATTDNMRRKNKQACHRRLLHQPRRPQWTAHQGKLCLPGNEWDQEFNDGVQRGMQPSRLALQHPAGALLK